MSYPSYKIVYYPLFSEHIDILKKHEFELDALQYDYERVDVIGKLYDILGAIYLETGSGVKSIDKYYYDYYLRMYNIEEKINKFIDHELNWKNTQYRLHKFYKIEYMNIFSPMGHMPEYHILLWLKKVVYTERDEIEFIEFKDLNIIDGPSDDPFIKHKIDSEWVKDRFIIVYMEGNINYKQCQY